MSPVPTVEASPGWRGVATVCRYRPGARQWTVAQLGAADTDTADTVTLLQNLQHTATMGEEVVLTAWQLYTALFVLFWAAQLYFSSFWMSVLCCIKVNQLYYNYRVFSKGWNRRTPSKSHIFWTFSHVLGFFYHSIWAIFILVLQRHIIEKKSLKIASSKKVKFQGWLNLAIF